MMTLHELLNRIQQEQDLFPAAQKLVAAYVVENFHQIPFLSITALAANIGVSENTIIKFCNHLGYNKFTEFKKVFSQYAHSELVMFNKLSEESGKERLSSQSSEEDIAAIQRTVSDPINQENLPKLLDMMGKARHIYVIGGRASGIVASLLSYHLRLLGLKVFEVTFGVGDYMDRLSIVDQDDLIIAFSFPRYTAHVVEAVERLHNKGIPVVLITDTGLSPAHPYADLAFHCAVGSADYFPNYSGCLSLINMICRATGAARHRDAAEHIRALEELLLESGVFL